MSRNILQYQKPISVWKRVQERNYICLFSNSIINIAWWNENFLVHILEDPQSLWISMAQHPEAIDKCTWAHGPTVAAQCPRMHKPVTTQWTWTCAPDNYPTGLMGHTWLHHHDLTFLDAPAGRYNPACLTQYLLNNQPYILTPGHTVITRHPWKTQLCRDQYPQWTCLCDLTCLIWCPRRLDTLKRETNNPQEKVESIQKELNETKASNLSDTKVKIIVIRVLKWLKTSRNLMRPIRNAVGTS